MEHENREQNMSDLHTPSLKDLEPEPSASVTLAENRIDALRAFTHNLATQGELLGLIGRLELPRLWTRHVLNSAVMAPLLREGQEVADIGTGGGMPGLVLAIVRPDVQFRLIEPMERRCNWLTSQASELGLTNVEVLRGRAEEFHDAFEVDVVTARAVTALKKLIPITVPLLRDGGQTMFLKGAGVDAEIEAATKQLTRFKLIHPHVEVLGEGLLTETTRVFRATVERARTKS